MLLLGIGGYSGTVLELMQIRKIRKHRRNLSKPLNHECFTPGPWITEDLYFQPGTMLKSVMRRQTMQAVNERRFNNGCSPIFHLQKRMDRSRGKEGALMASAYLSVVSCGQEPRL